MVTILLVEDDENKRQRTLALLNEALPDSVHIAEESNTTDAVQWLRINRCELLIVDLSIPLRRGESADKNGGERLLQTIVRADSQCHRPPNIVGLTAFNELRKEFRTRFEREGVVIVTYDQTSSEWQNSIANIVRGIAYSSQKYARRGVLIAIHGIRTSAQWHRTVADVANRQNWSCPIEDMWYGRFSIFQFLTPLARAAKVKWFRNLYTSVREKPFGADASPVPSVVAHSFGAYILGNSLLKYPDIHVDSVILCGCILPRDFPWDDLIKSGQVQRVLNLVGQDDVWARVCPFIIPGTGSSGIDGFSCSHPKLIQIVSQLSHNDFFDSRQISEQWFGFLNTPHEMEVGDGSNILYRCRGDHPCFSAVLSVTTFFIFASLLVGLVYIAAKAISVLGDKAIELIVRIF